MKRRRLHLLALLLALMLAVVAVGCGGDDDEEEGAGTTTAAAEEQVSGSVSIMGVWTGDEQRDFQAVIKGFTDENPDVTVKYNAVGDNLPTVLSTAVEGGNPPSLASVAQPGLIRGFVEKGAAKPLDFARDTIQENFGESGVQVGTFEGKLYGLLFKAANKSTIWYNVDAYEQAGVEPAEDWEAFLQNAKTINQSGIPAHSIAASQGWVLTDLFENIYIRTAGAEMYDQLSNHEIPWTHESVKRALREMAKVVGDRPNIVGGVAGALQTDFETSVSNVLSNSPKAASIIEGDFVPGVVEHPLKPGEGYDVFEFPAIDGSPPSVVGGGDMIVMFEDDPATRAFVEYLATPEAAEIWAKRGGFSSPNKKLDTGIYPDEILQKTAGAIGEAEVFRFDLSDVQPAAFGATEGQGLWKLFQDFFQNPNNIDGITRQMEAAAAAAFK